MNAPARFDTLPRYATAEKAIEALKPSEPLYLIRPGKFAAAARQWVYKPATLNGLPVRTESTLTINFGDQ